MNRAGKELLVRTAVEVPGKRPALWRKTPFDDLDELRKFRHFFRTRYAIDLDRAKLLAVADRALSAMPVVEEDVRASVEPAKGR
ncbi:MAG: hypothetical protein HYY17_17035 [Planctomycetes bacterium]|nr:hypothetical protein [Planctomycetota bacterium]